MNQHMAVGLTLLLAAVSGFAIWQGDVHAASVLMPASKVGVEPAPAAAASAGAAPRRTVASWLHTCVERLLDREFHVDLRRGEDSLSLQISWRERAPVVAGHPR